MLKCAHGESKLCKKMVGIALVCKRTALARGRRNHYRIQVFNMLPEAVKGLSNIQCKNKIKKDLREKAFYSIEGFLSNNFVAIL